MRLKHNDIVIYKKDGKVWLFDRCYNGQYGIYAVIKREGKVLDRVNPSDLLRCEAASRSARHSDRAVLPMKFALPARNPLAKVFF
jgi:hypothetical protein